VAVPSDMAQPPAAPVAAVTGTPHAPWQGTRPLSRPAHMLRYPVTMQSGAPIRPIARDDWQPAMRWDHRGDAALWTRAALAAVEAAGLPTVVPEDIAAWCPAYARNDDRRRAAFWAGVLSAMARYESNHDPQAVGGGGLYHGLLQILPSTARQYGCAAGTGEALRNATANLECAVLISAENVIRDDAVARDDGRNAGLARDWGPMTVDARAADMAEWTRAQDYCTLPTGVQSATLPPARPWTLSAAAAAPDAGAVELAMLSDAVREVRAIPAPRS